MSIYTYHNTCKISILNARISLGEIIKMAVVIDIDQLKKYINKKTSECWLWVGAISANGYGNYKNQGAHRVMYKLIKGAIESGMEIDHLCRVRNCVNPEHLEVVTHSENQFRAVPYRTNNGGGDYQKAKTHCPNGHEYNEKNTYIRPDFNWRRCKVCRRKGTK